MESTHGSSERGFPKSSVMSASRTIDMCLTKDETFPDLAQLMGYNSASGEYQSFPRSSNFRKRHALMLPPSLLEQISEIEWKIVAGVFSEINRAWLTVDNRIFLWNYKDQSDVVVYDGLDQIILSVGLVKPREGVFVDSVKWLLVLTTPVEIVILAVTFEDEEDHMELFEPSGSTGIGYSRSDLNTSTWSRNLSSSRTSRQPLYYKGDLKLNPTKFAVPTDNVNMLKVVGTKNGRIFMAGRDGSLNELLYQPEDGWFTRKCRKLNHSSSRISTFVPSFLKFHQDDPLENMVVDEHRNILYTLSSSNHLTVFDLGTSGEELEKIVTITSLVKDVTRTAPQQLHSVDPNLLSIVSMNVVSPSESLNVHLVCATRGGHRLYFTTQYPSSVTRFVPSQRPKKLILIHVRMPPNSAPSLGPSTPGASMNQQTNQHKSSEMSNAIADSLISFYSQGVFLYADSRGEEQDVLVSTCPDLSESANARPGASRPTLQETAEILDLEGKIWGLAESPLSQLVPASVLSLIKNNEHIEKNELAQQHLLPPRQFVVLTNSGLHLLEKTRPVDVLKDLLIASRGADTVELRQFFASYGIEQSCAMCLILATSSAPSEAQLLDTPKATSNSRRDPEIVSWATATFFRLGGRPMIDGVPSSTSDYDSSSTSLPPTSFGRISFSGSHDGFALYLSRLLQPIWAFNLFVLKGNGLACKLQHAQFVQLETQLIRLKHFLQQNPQFAAILSSNTSSTTSDRFETPQNTSRRNYAIDPMFEDAMRAEQQSLSNLHQILLRCLEALAFLRIMSETDMSQVSLSRISNTKIPGFKFKDFVTGSDPEIVRELIHAMTTVYSQQASHDDSGLAGYNVEELTATLRTKCPTFFSDSDKTRIKALDLLFKAKSSEHFSSFERTKLLKESLEQLKTIASDIVPILPEICQDYQYLRFYEGIVDLALACSKASDPHRLVLDWYKSGQRPNNETSKSLSRVLEDCYQQIIFALNELYGLDDTGTSRASSSPESQKNIFGASADSANIIERPALPDSEWKQAQLRTIKACRSSDDEYFHITFYQWFIEKNMATDLLQLETPYLENFLRFYCVPSDLRMHLLWQYYLHHSELTKAAVILLQLADMRGREQTLSDRLSHLAQALSLLKASASDHQLLREVQEKVEVGAVQLKIYNELEILADVPMKNEARSLLDYELFNISDLFNQFAKKYGLSESALAILHVSGHQDARLVRKLWETMIQDEVNLMKSGPPPYDATALSEKICNLALEYYPSEHVLPLDFLVETLEKVSVQLSTGLEHQAWYRGWVARTFLRAQIPATIIFKIYNQLFDSRTQFWVKEEHYVHLIGQICFVLEAWMVELKADHGRINESRMLKLKLENALEKYLGALGALATHKSAELAQLLTSLKRDLKKP